MARGYLQSVEGDRPSTDGPFLSTGPVTGSANVFSGTGIIHTITILSAGASCLVYDNTNASGTKVIDIVPTATELAKTIILDQALTTGLTYNSAASIVITYQKF